MIPVAKVQTELPFLDLGDETRVPGDGKFFDNDGRILTEQTSFLPSPFSNVNQIRISVGDMFYL